MIQTNSLCLLLPPIIHQASLNSASPKEKAKPHPMIVLNYPHQPQHWPLGSQSEVMIAGVKLEESQSQCRKRPPFVIAIG